MKVRHPYGHIIHQRYIPPRSINMKLFFILAVAVVAHVGASRRGTEGSTQKSLRMSTQRRAKSSLFHSPSNTFSKSSKSCGGMVYLGEQVNDPADQSAERTATLASIYADDTFFCENNRLCNTAGLCLAGADVSSCYDLGGNIGQVAVRLKTAWNYTNHSPLFECADILTGSPINLISSVGAVNPGDTTLFCSDLPSLFLISTSPPIDHTVTITVLSTGDSYTGETIPGGTVCEIHSSNGYTKINRSITRFTINIEGRDYEGSVVMDTDQTPPFPSTGGRIVLEPV